MVKTRRSEKVKLEAVKQEAFDVKPNISLPIRRKADKDEILPTYQRRYFTAPRQLKAKRFLERAVEFPDTFGHVGTEKWIDGLVDEIDQPGIVQKKNIIDWMTKNPKFFNPTNVPVPSVQKIPFFAIKKEIPLFAFKKEVKKEIKYEDSDDDMALFTAVKRVVKKSVKRKAKKHKETIKKHIKLEQPDEVDDYDSSVDSLFERVVLQLPFESKTELVEPLVVQDDEDIEQIPVPLIDISAPVQSTGEYQNGPVSCINIASLFQPAKMEPEKVGINQEEGGVTIETNSTEISVDSGINSGEEQVLPSSSSAFQEQESENLVMINGHNFLNLENSIVIPDNLLSQLQDNLNKFSIVVDTFTQLIDVFEAWHGFLFEPRNASIYGLFNELKAKIESLEKEYIEYIICRNNEL